MVTVAIYRTDCFDFSIGQWNNHGFPHLFLRHLLSRVGESKQKGLAFVTLLSIGERCCSRSNSCLWCVLYQIRLGHHGRAIREERITACVLLYLASPLQPEQGCRARNGSVNARRRFGQNQGGSLTENSNEVSWRQTESRYVHFFHTIKRRWNFKVRSLGLRFPVLEIVSLRYISFLDWELLDRWFWSLLWFMLDEQYVREQFKFDLKNPLFTGNCILYDFQIYAVHQVTVLCKQKEKLLRHLRLRYT